MTMTKESETYNGWTNYETWSCALWINNDQSEQEYFHNLARQALKHPGKNQYMTLERRQVHILAEALKEEFWRRAEAWMPDHASFFSDIFGAAMREVNWVEIAESLINDVREK